MKENAFEYDVALSFAGDDRPKARELAKLLAFRGAKVFYDEFEEARLWGKDLAAHLHLVYTELALFCIPFVSKHYVEKMWPRHEIQASLSKAISQRAEYILPVRLDDTGIPGLASTISYLDLRQKSLQNIADLCCEKLRIHENENPGSIVSKLRIMTEVPTWQLEEIDVKVTCPMCGGNGWEWVDSGDGDGEKDICRMDCENGQVSFFQFLQWLWVIYAVRRKGTLRTDATAMTDEEVKILVKDLYNVVQDRRA